MKKNYIFYFLMILLLSSCKYEYFYIAQANEKIELYPSPYFNLVSSDFIYPGDSFIVYKPKFSTRRKVRVKSGNYYVITKKRSTYHVFPQMYSKSQEDDLAFMSERKSAVDIYNSSYQNYSTGNTSTTTVPKENNTTYQNYGTGHTIHTGPRGGRYYINKNGNKTYIKRKK